MSTCPGLNVRWSTYYVHSSTAVWQWLPHLFLSVWYERKYESIVVYKPNRLFYLISLIISTYKTLTFSHTLSVMRSLISHCAYSFKKIQYFYSCRTSFMHTVYFDNVHPLLLSQLIPDTFPLPIPSQIPALFLLYITHLV